VVLIGLGCSLLAASKVVADVPNSAGKIRLVSLQQAHSSLEKLKHRSAIDRIKELKKKFGWEVKKAEQPVSLEAPKAIDKKRDDSIRLFPPSERRLLGIDDRKTIPSFDLPAWEVTDQKSKSVIPLSATPQQNQKKEKEKPNALKKIGEILPYADYAPDLGNKSVNEKTYPEEKWPYKKPYKPREFEESVFAWEPSNLFYNPLYFEDAPLERYGHSYPDIVQPFVSLGKFSVQLIGLPYQMAIDPVNSLQSPLGWYRPGEYAPKLIYQIPWNRRAALTEAGVITGLFFIIP